MINRPLNPAVNSARIGRQFRRQSDADADAYADDDAHADSYACFEFRIQRNLKSVQKAWSNKSRTLFVSAYL